MIGAAAQRYRQVGLETAGRGAILLALYDGAIRFARQGAEAIRRGDLARKGEHLHRVMSIVAELQATLDHSKAPDLCDRLERLYDYAQDRLELANRRLDAAAVEEVASLLETLREGWRQAVAQDGAAR
jgi:flagellar protein FliS